MEFLFQLIISRTGNSPVVTAHTQSLLRRGIRELKEVLMALAAFLIFIGNLIVDQKIL